MKIWQKTSLLLTPRHVRCSFIQCTSSSFEAVSKHPLHQLICSSSCRLSFTPTLPASIGWSLTGLCVYSLEVSLSNLLFARDGWKSCSMAAQLIIAHTGPTEGMALRSAAWPSQPAVWAFLSLNRGSWDSCISRDVLIAKSHSAKAKQKSQPA